MKIDIEQYGGPCACGMDHAVNTKFVIIEPGCLKNIDAILAERGIEGKRCTLYGEKTFAATADRHPAADQEIVLKSEGLHANEIAVGEVLEKLHDDIKVIVAVGSGTIHDVARYCAYKRGLKFIACPTGASVDGFCSTVAAMTWYGYKRTLPAVAPEVVIADSEIIKAAPDMLVRSGVGDILAKFIALSDWRIANLLTGEHFCEKIYTIMKDALDTVVASLPELAAGQESAYDKVIYALVMSGVAMQMMGNSRPASGAEHHISHMIEMGAESLDVQFPALHGEKTGVGAILAAAEYKRLCASETVTEDPEGYKPLDDDTVMKIFGEKLFEGIKEENADDCLLKVAPGKLAEKWNEIRAIVAEIPEASELYAMLESIGAKNTLESIGVSSDKLPIILNYSPYVRNRLTLMRVKRIIG